MRDSGYSVNGRYAGLYQYQVRAGMGIAFRQRDIQGFKVFRLGDVGITAALGDLVQVDRRGYRGLSSSRFISFIIQNDMK